MIASRLAVGWPLRSTDLRSKGALRIELSGIWGFAEWWPLPLSCVDLDFVPLVGAVAAALVPVEEPAAGEPRALLGALPASIVDDAAGAMAPGRKEMPEHDRGWIRGRSVGIYGIRPTACE